MRLRDIFKPSPQRFQEGINWDRVAPSFPEKRRRSTGKDVPQCRACGCDALGCNEVGAHSKDVQRANAKAIARWRLRQRKK